MGDDMASERDRYETLSVQRNTDDKAIKTR